MANNYITTNSQITGDWLGGYKLEVDLTAEQQINDWELSFSLPDDTYSIRGVYGVELEDHGGGNYSFSGLGDWKNFHSGEKAKAIFVIDDSRKQAIAPEFKEVSYGIDAKAEVTEDWKGGYKLEVDLSTAKQANNWQLNFNLPASNYSIKSAYGVDLVNNGNGNYSVSGQGGWQNLEPGEQAKAIFIVNDNGHQAIAPEFSDVPQSIAAETISPAPANDDYQLSGSPVSEPISTPKQLSSNAIYVDFEGHGNNTSYNYSAQSADWKVDWTYQMDKFATISNEASYSGDNSLKLRYPANQQSNAGSKWVVPASNEYYFSYWLKFDNDFDFDGNKYSGGKLPGLGEGELASGGNKPNGNNGFTSRYMWREDGKAVLYLYHMDQPGTYGEDILLKDSSGNTKYFERGEWHHMIQRVKTNSAGAANGEIDVWMDNEQVLSVDNLRLNNGQGVDTAYFSSFHGGYGSDWWPSKDDNAYFDDFVVSTNAADVGL